MSLRTIAIAGASGNLGSKIAQSILDAKYANRFKEIVLLARQRSSGIEKLAALGATVRIYSEANLSDSLAGIDVLINAVGPAGHHFKQKLLQSIPSSQIKLYFPSEFGVNHYIHDFPHEEWDAKKAHFQQTKDLPAQVHVCRVYAGLFLEDSIGPWFGFFTRENKYEAIGSLDQHTSYTSMYDVGKALAILASGPLTSIPPEVQLNGDSKSMRDISHIMQHNGAPTIELTSITLPPYKDKVLQSPIPTPERNLRFLMGEGKIDHSEEGIGNQNALIESGHDVEFSWKSIQDIAKESGGIPWADVPWPPSS